MSKKKAPAAAAAPAVTTPEAPAIAAPPKSEHDLGGSSDRGRARLYELADKLGRTWGNRTAMPLSVAPVARLMRLPFGILMLDWRSGGGVAIGRWNRIWGRKSVLKTTLCLRLLRQAQRTCRHCKGPLVTDPETKTRDCRCPNPRYWLKDEDDYQWLPADAAIKLAYGQLPDGVTEVAIKGEGKFQSLKCAPPPHLCVTATGTKKDVPARNIPFVETYRCEPMRCLYLDGENTITEEWARLNGVDTSLVLLIGSEWAEQSLSSIEESVLTREFDIVFIDSTSVLDPKSNIEKPITDSPVVAARANVMGRFVRKLHSAGFEGLTARYRPTVVCTSQVSMHGIGYGQHAHLAPTDGNALEHALTIDIRMHEEGYEFDKSGQHAIYGKFGFEITKNKAGGGSPGATGSIKFWMRPDEDHDIGDSDDLVTVMTYARELGRKVERQDADRFIEETSKGLVLTSKFVKGGAVPFSRVGDCARYLRENPTVYDDLRARVLAQLRADDANLIVGGTGAPTS
jgi:RecA/RadA recombinase